MVHCAETNEEARRNAAESILWYLRKSTELIGSLATWQAERERELGTYAYAQSLRDLDMSYLTFELLDDMGAVIVGDPEPVHGAGAASTATRGATSFSA